MKIGEYVMVRTNSAGVFAGTLESMEEDRVVLTGARRIWYWAGAVTLSQLAMDGTKEPNSCKFPIPVTRVMLFKVIEILDISPKAEKSIREVPVWEK